MVVFKELVKTDFQLRYQGSFLGMVWSVLKPLMLFAVMYVVFVKFLKFSDGTPTFPISLLCGTCLWSFFSESTSMGLQSIVGRGDLLRRGRVYNPPISADHVLLEVFPGRPNTLARTLRGPCQDG